jgi:hypothetical protein
VTRSPCLNTCGLASGSAAIKSPQPHNSVVAGADKRVTILADRQETKRPYFLTTALNDKVLSIPRYSVAPKISGRQNGGTSKPRQTRRGTRGCRRCPPGLILPVGRRRSRHQGHLSVARCGFRPENRGLFWGRQRRRAFQATKSWSKAMTSKWKYRNIISTSTDTIKSLEGI